MPSPDLLAAPTELTALPLDDLSVPLTLSISKRVEFMELALALAERNAISLSSPLRSDAFRALSAHASHPAIEGLRDLKAQGLEADHLMALMLSHSEPPKFSPNRPVDRWLPAWGEGLSKREKQKKIQKTISALSDLYDVAKMDAYFEKYADDYADITQALEGALPRGEPVQTLKQNLALDDRQVILVPSVIAGANRAIPLAAPGELAQTIVVVMALPDGKLPFDEGAQANLRYQAVAHALLSQSLESYAPEMTYASQLINNAVRLRAPQDGIQVQLGGAGVLSPEKLTQAITQALFLHSIQDQGDWVQSVRRDLSDQMLPIIDAMVANLQQTGIRAGQLTTQIPELLDAAIRQAQGSGKRPTLAGDFERWEGQRPIGWTITANNAPRQGSQTSAVGRGDDEIQGGYLHFEAQADTTRWQEATSAPISVQPGDQVIVRAKIRPTDVTQNAGQLVGAHIFAQLKTSQGALIRRVQGRPLRGSSDWQESQISLEIPANTASLHLGATLGMAGQADFDDFELEIQRPDSLHLLQFGGFELAESESPTGWQKVIIAQNPVDGPSVDSVWNLSQNTPYRGKSNLMLKGGPQTSTWYGMQSGDIRTSPGRRVKLVGQTKATGVHREGMQQRHANLAIEFLNERGAVIHSASSPITEGDSDWQMQTLDVTAPINAVWLRVICQLSESGMLEFDDLHLSQR